MFLNECNSFFAGLHFFGAVCIGRGVEKAKAIEHIRIFFCKGQGDVATHGMTDECEVRSGGVREGIDLVVHEMEKGIRDAFDAHVFNHFRLAAAGNIRNDQTEIL